jgi:hypothetical protein
MKEEIPTWCSRFCLVAIVIDNNSLIDNMTEMTEEEITAKIGALGDQIKNAKAEKKPKEEWDPLLKEMLALKVRAVDMIGV